MPRPRKHQTDLSSSISLPPASEAERIYGEAAVQFAQVVGAGDPARTEALFWETYALAARSADPSLSHADIFAHALSDSAAGQSFSLHADAGNSESLILDDENRFEVVGGTDAGLLGFPECIAVCRMDGNTLRLIGSAVLISRTAALTAAHVIRDATNNFQTATFLVCAHPTIGNAPPDSFRPAQGAIYPQYNPFNRFSPRHDLGLIQFVPPASFNIPLAVLAPQEWVDSAVVGTIAGYGSNDTGAHRGHGVRRFGQTSLGTRTTFEIFVGPEEPDSPLPSACKGDSGGPLFLFQNNRRFLAGVNSRGMDEAISPCGQATIFTRVLPYLAFYRHALS